MSNFVIELRARMLIEVKDKVVSTQIFDRKFVCDLNACKGACCVEGDAGAPLLEEEIELIENDLEKIKPFMRAEGIEVVNEEGVWYNDEEGHPATTLVNHAECAFVHFDADGTAKCAIEQAYLASETKFKKPISCHLYPIRAKKYEDFEALNYEEWHICKPACACGERLNVPVYRFLKEPLIRAYGEEFFSELELVEREWTKQQSDS